MGSFFVTVGRIAYQFATRAAAQAFAKGRSGASNITKSAPKGLQVRPGPKPATSAAQPRNPSTGKMQKPQPSPATRRDTSPSAASPKKPSMPSTTDKSPKAVTTRSSSNTGVSTRSTGSSGTSATGRGKPPMMPKSMVKERPNMGRPKMSSKAAGTRSSTLDFDGERKSQSTTPTNKSGEMPLFKKESTKPTNKSGEMPSLKKESTSTASTKKETKTITRPKMNPLDNWSDARRKTLRSDKIGQDAGDGMKWVVGSNSNALVRTRDMDRVKENLRLQKLVKQTKDTTKRPDTSGR